jgi:gremlin
MTRVQFAAIFLLIHIVDCQRRESASIMDIINTQQVKKILADRRRNSNHDEDATESENDIYPSADTIIDFDYNTNQPPRNNRTPLPIRGDIVMSYNDTSILPSLAARFSHLDANTLADLQNFRGDKVLKSSKSALYIAKKELLKQDWCKTEPFQQKIREDGCYSKRITNNFCYGQCNSFYIPKMSKRRKRAHGGKRNKHQVDSFRSCAYCKPKEYKFMTVTLKCPSLTPSYRRKRIQIVQECRCIAQNMDN